ncbi:MAG: TetR family transcriptional regulator [Rhodospirillaceae bacterium]
MARKKTAAKKSSARKASADPSDAIIDAALALAAEAGWTTLAMAAVAARAGVPLGDVLLYAPTRAHLLARFLDRLDAGNLKGVDRIDESESARDRLFEVLMRRFDLLNRQRDAVRAVIAGVPRDPPAAAMLACRVGRSAAALLGAAGISAEGLPGFVRIQGLKAVMAFTLRAWMNDDSGDMAKTMAALDRALDRAERFARFTPWRRTAPAPV